MIRDDILTLLNNTEDFLSGQEISEKLGVSRTAVWKHINSLKNMGYDIESVNNKGYRLLSSPDLLTADVIMSYLKTDFIKEICYYPKTDSTNIRAKSLSAEGKPSGTLVIAEEQTAGKGRRGRAWISPPKEAIYMSLLIKPDIDVVNASMLTLIAAMAITKAIKELFPKNNDCFIKWPNDVVVGGKKICGILTEMTTEADYIKDVVIGIGINANTKKFDKEISDIATSLYLAYGTNVNRAELVALVMEYLGRYYEVYLKTQDMSNLLDEYNSMLVNIDREIMIIENEKEWHAKALGINDRGALIVETSDGTKKEIISGEVSVRGIYGYV